jgi:hypothetical protein
MDHAAFNPTYLELQQFAFASDNTSNVRTPAPKSSPLKAPQHDEARSVGGLCGTRPSRP